MMTLRSRIFVVISLIVLIILSVSLLLVARSKKDKPAVGDNQGNNSENGLPALPNYSGNGSSSGEGGESASNRVIRRPSAEEVSRNAAKQLAKIFIERYATFSSDNNFQNIKEVQFLVTPALWSNISARIGVASARSGFTGVTTEVISAGLSEWSDNAAVAALKIRRAQEKDGARTTGYFDVKVWLVKSGENWLADKFEMK